MTCIFCGQPLDYASDPGSGWSDMALVTTTGRGASAVTSAFCPDPAALSAPGALVGQLPTHQSAATL